jgi:dolichyl-phosphate beta-glucosyltransferase
MSNQTFDLSLIIPAYNESKLIGITLHTLVDFLGTKKIYYQIIVVDDGSSDETVKLVHEFEYSAGEKGQLIILENDQNRGKGYSLKKGILAANGSIRLFVDADLPFEMESIDQIIAQLNAGCDVAIGARDMPGSTMVGVPFMRFLAGQIFSVLVQIFAFRGIHDTQCGLKGFSKDASINIFSRSTINDFGIDVELLFLAKKFGYHICRIPVKMTGFRSDSRIHLAYDSIKMIFELFKIRINDAIGKYK